MMYTPKDTGTSEYEIRENRYRLERIRRLFENYPSHFRVLITHMERVLQPTTRLDDIQAIKALKSLAKNVKKKDLQTLNEAICKQSSATQCAIWQILKADQANVGGQLNFFPHVFFCKIWRFHDVLTHHELRPLRHCKAPFNKNIKITEVCINPYHYDRVPTDLVSTILPRVWLPLTRGPEPQTSTSTAYTNFENETFEYDELCSPGGVPNATIDENKTETQDVQSPTTSEAPEPMDTTQFIQVKYSHPDCWCDIIYYELNQRVGNKFSAKARSIIVDGFTSPTDEDRFCLGMLNNVNRDRSIIDARKDIGRGIRLYSIQGEVFIESLSEHSVFVQSPNSNMRLGFHAATVCKVPRNVSLLIFNMKHFEKMFREAVERGYEAVYSLMRMCVLRISFVKGWGTSYRRSKVTSTPCWIEVYLRGPLEWLDSALTQMGPPNLQCSSNT